MFQGEHCHTAVSYTHLFNKISLKFREPIILPKTIPLDTIQKLLKTIYQEQNDAKTEFQKKCILRDIAVVELLFMTGMRISELCLLKSEQVDFQDNKILIFGKGAKERIIQIGSDSVIKILKNYSSVFYSEISKSGWFFVNRLGKRYSEQSVRAMIKKIRKKSFNYYEYHTTYVSPLICDTITRSRR